MCVVRLDPNLAFAALAWIFFTPFSFDGRRASSHSLLRLSLYAFPPFLNGSLFGRHLRIKVSQLCQNLATFTSIVVLLLSDAHRKERSPSTPAITFLVKMRQMEQVRRTIPSWAILTNGEEEETTTTTAETTTATSTQSDTSVTTTSTSTIVTIPSTTSTTDNVRVCIRFCFLSNRDRFLQAAQFTTLFPPTGTSTTSTLSSSTFTTTSGSLLPPLTGTGTSTGLPSPSTTAPAETNMSTGLVLGSLAGGVAAIAIVGYGAAWLMVGTLYLFFSDQVY